MLPLEWYPQWWIESPVQLWLSAEGNWIFLVWLVAAAWALELASFARMEAALPHRRELIFRCKAVWYALHVCWMFVTFAVADVAFWIYASALWAGAALLPAAVAVVLKRHAAKVGKRSLSGGGADATA